MFFLKLFENLFELSFAFFDIINTDDQSTEPFQCEKWVDHLGFYDEFWSFERQENHKENTANHIQRFFNILNATAWYFVNVIEISSIGNDKRFELKGILFYET